MRFDDNSVFHLAWQFVDQTDRHVFLTGKAGTGKTTFLKYVRDHCPKRMAITAPTGVAAIHAGGVTLHSLFQLPFGPYIPVPFRSWGNSAVNDPNSLFKNLRLSAAKRELLQELELLVIDEISMVRADMLDAVDRVLRHFRQQPLLPFGGVQMLYIGDLFQLPPVVNRDEWELLRSYYDSPFFFDAHAIRSQPPANLELKKIYRQKSAGFIGILNNIRNNRATEDDLEQLHTRYDPDFQPGRDQHYIILTTHNAKAVRINEEELNALRGRQYNFEATVTGEFNERSYPAEKTLCLKAGAQIMFIKNDKGESRRWFNGKIGTIEKISEQQITVRFPNERDTQVVEKEVWKNIRYNYHREKDKIEEEELGSFSQYPIRLAWAITIHKSQGLTFERAVIDAGASFAPGQVYVALSRLTQMEGLVLHSRIYPNSIHTDERVIDFTERAMTEEALQVQLRGEQEAFARRSLLDAFSWFRVVEEVSLLSGPEDSAGLQQVLSLSHIDKLSETVKRQHEMAVKFTRQLEQLLDGRPGKDPGDGSVNPGLQERVDAATAFFIQVIDKELLSSVREQTITVRGMRTGKKYLPALNGLKALFERKKRQLEQAKKLAGLIKATPRCL